MAAIGQKRTFTIVLALDVVTQSTMLLCKLAIYNKLELTAMKPRLLIFDLDETLVHATKEKLPHAHHFEVAPYFVYVRPYVEELLKFSTKHFDIAVWSSSSPEYVEVVTANLFGNRHPAKFSWSVNKCVQKEDPRTNGYVYIKDLRKVQKHGYAVDEILMIDDSPEKIRRQPRNHIAVRPYLGEQSDQELLALIEKLESMLV